MHFGISSVEPLPSPISNMSFIAYPLSHRQNGRCECNEGWQGDGDFVNATGMDCQISTVLYNNWYLVYAILWWIQVVYTYDCLRSAFSVTRATSLKKFLGTITFFSLPLFSAS